MTKKIIAMILLCLFFTNCNHFNNKTITKTDVQTTIDTMLNIFGNAWQENIERGVNQVALFWEKTDGNKNDFKQFCINNFIADSTQKHLLFERLCENFESIYGLNNKMMVTSSTSEGEDVGSTAPLTGVLLDKETGEALNKEEDDSPY